MVEHYEQAATDLDALAARMPEWTDAEGGPADEAWKQRFAELFKTVPADALLTVVDVHS